MGSSNSQADKGMLGHSMGRTCRVDRELRNTMGSSYKGDSPCGKSDEGGGGHVYSSGKTSQSDIHD